MCGAGESVKQVFKGVNLVRAFVCVPCVRLCVYVYGWRIASVHDTNPLHLAVRTIRCATLRIWWTAYAPPLLAAAREGIPCGVAEDLPAGAPKSKKGKHTQPAEPRKPIFKTSDLSHAISDELHVTRRLVDKLMKVQGVSFILFYL